MVTGPVFDVGLPFGPNLLGSRDRMDAEAAPGGSRTTRRKRHVLEDRRVLAPLLIAPAVIFMALVVGIPFGWAIYLSLTDALGGSLRGHFVGLDNFTNAWSD